MIITSRSIFEVTFDKINDDNIKQTDLLKLLGVTIDYHDFCGVTLSFYLHQAR